MFKIRTSPVSNSSSSSFILSLTDYESIFDIARKMIPAREWDNDQTLIDNLNKMEQGGVDPNNDVSFNSCNYETYITKNGEYAIVETCNNHWWDDFVNTIYSIPNSLRSYSNVDIDYGEIKVMGKEKYILVEKSLNGTPFIASPPENHGKKYCEECYSGYWETNNGEQICPRCI